MFAETLSGDTAKALALLGRTHRLDHAYLAGGTACALQLGHRISVDLDFFTQQEFDSKDLGATLSKIGRFELDRESWGTVVGQLEGVHFSIFFYKYPVLLPFQFFQGIRLADLRDIAAMKIAAISDRGLKRDFIDLYYICRSGISLQEMLDLYDRKYQTLASNMVHIQKSLVYFVDADASENPVLRKPTDWNQVKRFFECEVKRLASA